MYFEAEAKSIRIDNCSSKCISNDLKDFIPSSVRKCTMIVKGFKGEQCKATHKGTIKWDWEDDDGMLHTFLIPNSYFMPQAVARLLCPQHWAQENRDDCPLPNGTGCDTNFRAIMLYWQQRSKTRTIPLDTKLNVGVLPMAPEYRTSDFQCAKLDSGCHRRQDGSVRTPDQHRV